MNFLILIDTLCNIHHFDHFWTTFQDLRMDHWLQRLKMVRMKGSKDLKWYPMLLNICIQESQLEKFLLLCNPLYPDYWNTLNNSFSSIFSISKTFGYLTPHLLELDYFRLKEKLFNPVHLFYVARFFSKICVLCSFITVENWVVLLLILHFSKRGFYFYMWYNLPTNVT